MADLEPKHYQNAVHLSNLEKNDAIYLLKHNPTKTEDVVQSPAVFRAIGKGDLVEMSIILLRDAMD